MARGPASDSGSENYLFAVVGFGDQGHLTVETKTTVDERGLVRATQWLEGFERQERLPARRMRSTAAL
jgi:hypothetical protein